MLFVFSVYVCADEDFEWLPVDWISNWLTEPDKAQPITTVQYLCPHQK